MSKLTEHEVIRINGAINHAAAEGREAKAQVENLRQQLAAEQQARIALEQRVNTLFAQQFNGGSTAT